jgi:hypothetical protein
LIATPPALQDVWPHATCFGCGPGNPHGLRIKSYWSENQDEVICTFSPQPYFNAGFENVMYGGLVACLCDCHSIWTAIAETYRQEGREHGSLPAVSYVTGTLTVSYHKPTPLDQPVVLRAHVEKLEGRKTRIICGIYADGQRTAEAQVLGIRIVADKSLGAKHTP